MGTNCNSYLNALPLWHYYRYVRRSKTAAGCYLCEGRKAEGNGFALQYRDQVRRCGSCSIVSLFHFLQVSPSTTAAAVLSTIYRAMKYENTVKSSFGRTEEALSHFQVNLNYISHRILPPPNHILSFLH